MLNIETRISLSKASKRRVKKFWKHQKGILNGSSWKSMHNSIKNEISEKLFQNQQFKCCYCERYLAAMAPQIDHFAHKADYPRFTFNPTNLFYACSFCNSSIKGQKNTVLVIDDRYDRTIFSIIHPYRNNPDTEIVFSDEDRVILDMENCTDLGRRTIAFFQYDKPLMTNIRARDLLFQRMNPLVSEQEQILIQESIAYK